MPVPEFTEHGVLPAGVHTCSFPEAELVLSSNLRRSEIWQGLLEFLQWSAGLPSPTALLLDGSYVTDKADPSDLDVVVDVTTCSEDGQSAWFQAFGAKHVFVKESFFVDFYPFVVGAGSDFSVFFQYVRVEDALRRGIPPNVRKGILRVKP